MTESPRRVRVRLRTEAVSGVNDEPTPDRPTPNVGYGHPPVEHQFKPGQSGNPKGRRKGSRNRATMIAEAMSQRIRTKIDGKVQRLMPMEALIHVVLNKALGGDRHAWEIVFGWDEEAEASKSKRDALQSFSEKDQAVFRRMEERYSRRRMGQ